MHRYVLVLGLQVKCSSGDYINVPYRPDAVLVNLGALMQNWTSDTYLATVRNIKLLTHARRAGVIVVGLCVCV